MERRQRRRGALNSSRRRCLGYSLNPHRVAAWAGGPAAVPGKDEAADAGAGVRRGECDGGGLLIRLGDAAEAVRYTAMAAAGEPSIAAPSTEAESIELVERSNLTSRERRIMQLLVTGHAIPEIMGRFRVAGKTVRDNLSNICATLQVHRRSAAILLWLGHGRRQPPSA